jgi:hypothetical protein
MIMDGNEKVLNGLMREAYGAGDDSPYMNLLHIIMDMEYRIKALETKPDPMPVFSGIPITPIMNFMTINELRGKTGLPPYAPSEELNGKEQPVYSYLVSKGCNRKDAAAIAKEIEEIGHGK